MWQDQSQGRGSTGGKFGRLERVELWMTVRVRRMGVEGVAGMWAGEVEGYVGSESRLRKGGRRVSSSIAMI
jgi:hypothetical protein